MRAEKLLKNLNAFMKSKEVHVFIRQESALCSDQTETFPCTSRSGNQHIIIIYFANKNTILTKWFKNKIKQELTTTYAAIKNEIDIKIVICMHAIDNEARITCANAIEDSDSQC